MDTIQNPVVMLMTGSLIVEEPGKTLPAPQTVSLWKDLVKVFRQLCATAAPEVKPVLIEFTWFERLEEGVFISLSRVRYCECMVFALD